MDTENINLLLQQNAELQKELAAKNRELEIEVALEEVRSRSLSMQQSDELKDVVQVVFDNLKHLGFVFDDGAVSILLFREGSRDHLQWTADSRQAYAVPLEVSYTDHSIPASLMKAREDGVDFFAKLFPVEEKNEYFTYLFMHSNYRDIPEAVKKLILGSEHYGYSVAFGEQSAILIPTNSGRLVKGEQKETLVRFAKVFEQAYIRFLDLQRAEAQAREAQVEAALERVRSRTMAMQRSEELSDVATVLFQQVKALGVPQWTCGFCIWDIGDTECIWYPGGPENEILASSRFPLTEHPVFKLMDESRRRGDELYIYEKEGEVQADHYRYMMTLPGVRELLQGMLDAGLTFPPFQIDHYANFAYGNLIFITYEHYPEMHDIFKRFAKVFEQTYTRFLDLQRAEASAREAEIEAGLERVRAAANAMHKSTELLNVISVLSEQFQQLGFHIDSANFNTSYREKDWNLWLYNPGFPMYSDKIHIPYFDHPYFNRTIEALANGSDFNAFVFNKEDKDRFLDYIYKNTIAKHTSEERKKYTYSKPGFAWSAVYLKNTAVTIANYDAQPYTEEQNAILRRFGSVFEQSYTRFLDLQKAEAQAREADIQLALERVRARSLAMHQTAELQEVVNMVAQQLMQMNVAIDGGVCIVVNEEVQNDMPLWASAGAADYVQKITVPVLDRPIFTRMREAIINRAVLLTEQYTKEEKDEFFRHLFSHHPWDKLSSERKEELLARDGGYSRSLAAAHYTSIVMINHHGNAFSESDNAILKRFGGVLEQSYIRFLDLQKAELQAREAQIELGLERVRARAMAMQTSEELNALVGTLFTELTKLDFVLTRCVIMIYDPKTKDARWLMANSEAPDQPMSYLVQFHTHLPYLAYVKAWQERTVKWVYVLQGEIKKEWDDFLFSETELSLLPAFVIDGMRAPECVYLNASFANFGSLTLASLEPLPEEHFNILIRFANVFDLTYTRFNDLKQAEAQAREAQIEAALEKVRSRSLAVYKSDEFSEVIKVVFERLEDLEIPMTSVSINALIPGTKDANVYICGAGEDGLAVSHIRLVYFDHPIVNDRYEAYEKGLDFFSKTYSAEVKNSFYEYEFEVSDLKYIPADIRQKVMESQSYTMSTAFAKNSMIVVNDFKGKSLSLKEIDIVKRFARVFEQAYIRFLDLQKAEAQAREATIEAALERVRSKAMAMHNSNDLSAAASMVFTELRTLGINPIRCGVGLLNKESRKAQLYSATSSVSGDSLSLVGWVLLEGHPVLEKIYDSWLNNEAYFPELSGEQLRTYYELLLAGLSVTLPDWQSGQKQYGHFFPFSNGCLYAWSAIAYNDAEIKILKRFASIIDLTFRRYMDLQKSEASAREAIKQAALDRVRADIASMRTVGDLDRITPLIWNELTTLGIPFTRCGVFIMDDEQAFIHTFLSTPDGKAIAAFHLPYSTPGNIAQVLTHWKEKKIYTDHWDERTFTEFANTIVSQGALASAEYYLKTIPHGGFYLHFLPFLQGMLYVGNTALLGEEEINLLQSVAEAFSTAYARYEDFNKLDVAKRQVDKTLAELKQTQQQLIQAEKMASLGELTAGIAHEIQNPLNFVNNFSSVNKELIEELQQANGRGDQAEVYSIAADIKVNEEKIAHHGQRADSIVKGMLQHARASTGKKEPTNINQLADEYLRLSYQGMRAKDKSFNATITTHFDDAAGQIYVVPQDLGRVLLNLLNNAFYTVHQKKQQVNGAYDPVVSVITKREGNCVVVIVKDNGTGMPEKIQEKVFQPFFTTKPTGEGTGLGLSLSYDIVTKGHGGEIKVESKEGEGTAFIVQLPVI